MINVALFAENNYDTDLMSERTGYKSTKPSKTQQSQKEESDINTIVRRFGLTGQLPENIKVPQYGDFTGIKDYQSALNVVRMAKESFDRLPIELRIRFRNDAEAFVNFVTDPENEKECQDMGLIPKRFKNEPAAQGGVSPTEVGGKKPDENSNTA